VHSRDGVSHPSENTRYGRSGGVVGRVLFNPPRFV